MPMDRRRRMTPLAVTVAVAGALAVAEAGVRLLRPREEAIAPAPVEASDYFSADEIERARAFRRPQRALALAAVAADAALLAALVARPPRVLARRHGRPVVAAAATGAALSTGLTAATLPISAVSRARSLKVGLATQSWPGWAADVAKSSAIGAVFAAAGGAAGVGLMRRFPRTWWAPGAAVAVGFGVLTTYLGPVVLDPIFNRFTPLPEGRERADVLDLARRAGVDVGEVYEVDASRRTTAANAYVNGLGRTKRVVLFDTLIRDFTRDEVRLVVAHELGHVRHDDVRRLLAYLAIVAPAGTLAVARVTEALQPPDEPAGPRALPALALAAMLVGTPVTAVANRLSRRIEARTDDFALRLTNAPEPFIGFEKRITVKNIAEPEPPGWAEVLFGTHPTTLQRIGAAVAFREQALPAARRTPAGS
jgi:STE24 endopeptidase